MVNLTRAASTSTSTSSSVSASTSATEDYGVDASGDTRALAEVAKMILQWRWTDSALTNEQNRMMSGLMVGAYLAALKGDSFNKTRAAEMMGIEPGKTAAKYVGLAEELGWITIDRSHGPGQRPQDVIQATSDLTALVEEQLRAIRRDLANQGMMVTRQLSEPISRSQHQDRRAQRAIAAASPSPNDPEYQAHHRGLAASVAGAAGEAANFAGSLAFLRQLELGRTLFGEKWKTRERSTAPRAAVFAARTQAHAHELQLRYQGTQKDEVGRRAREFEEAAVFATMAYNSGAVDAGRHFAKIADEVQLRIEKAKPGLLKEVEQRLETAQVLGSRIAYEMLQDGRRTAPEENACYSPSLGRLSGDPHVALVRGAIGASGAKLNYGLLNLAQSVLPHVSEILTYGVATIHGRRDVENALAGMPIQQGYEIILPGIGMATIASKDCGLTAPLEPTNL